MRYSTNKVCKECRSYGWECLDNKQCEPVRKKLRSYAGIRHTADGFDCALPVTIDSHSIDGDGNIIYKYKGLDRKYFHSQWEV